MPRSSVSGWGAKHKGDFKWLCRQFYLLRKKKKSGFVWWNLSQKIQFNFTFCFKTKPILRTITNDTMRKISSLEELSVVRWSWANCKSHHPGTIIWAHFSFKESHINGRSAFHYPSHLMHKISLLFHWPEYIELIWECIIGLLNAFASC